MPFIMCGASLSSYIEIFRQRCFNVSNMLTLNKHNQGGFTIVELLIVIVIIAILAAITVVAYNGVQNRARDSAIQESGSVLQRVMELYRADNGAYPICSSGNGSSCALSSITSILVPQYASKLPDDATYPYWYVGYTTSTDTYWGVRIYKPSISNYCKVGSPNMFTNWWSSAPLC